jgi:TonB-dependent SusC/RagA subfamily outer membrane receptor
MSSHTHPLIRSGIRLAVCCAAFFGAMAACGPAGIGTPARGPTIADRVEIAEGHPSSGESRAASAAGTDARLDGAARVEDLLIGRVPGVEVRRTPGGGRSVHIRGGSSLSGSGEPLYVVDGVEVFVAPGRGLDWLSPADVASINLLKDAVSTAMYGVRGGNGVILITTRRAR